MPPLLRCRALSLAPPALVAAGHTPCPPAQCTQVYGIGVDTPKRAQLHSQLFVLHASH